MSKKVAKNKHIFLGLDKVKYCPLCGRQSISQYPQEIENGILNCTNCNGTKFKVELV